MDPVRDYHQLAPVAPLDRYIARAAQAHFTEPVVPERLAPDGYIKLSIILSGDPLYTDMNGAALGWVSGFAGHMSPERPVHVASTTAVHVVWANFLPSGFHRLFNRPVNELTECFVVPETFLNGSYAALWEALTVQGDPQERVQLLVDAFFAGRDLDDLARPTPMQRVEDHIRATHGTATMDELAAIAGFSVRQLERRSLIELGASPKTFSSIVRFNYAYQLMKAQQKLDLDIALHCGYYDESHMLRDLAYYLGGSSKQYVDLVRPVVDRNLGH